MAASHKFRIALIQLAVTANKADNLRRAAECIAKAAQNGAQIVALPECCNSPFGNQYFEEYAEEIPGESTEHYAKAAADNGVCLIAGSIPERLDGKLYNTTTAFSSDGTMLAQHRKVHLFDIDVPGKMTFQESKTLTPGNSLTMFDTELCSIGLGICYDMRFAEMAQLYARKGCQLLVYPGCFNMTTGPAHWELVARARALDNQCYVAAVSTARDESASYITWGHSLVVSPWGEIIARADEKEQIIYADIDLDYMKEVRAMLPMTLQRRLDLYDVVSRKDL